MRQDRRQFELLEKKVARLEEEVKALKEAQAPAAAPKVAKTTAKLGKDLYPGADPVKFDDTPRTFKTPVKLEPEPGVEKPVKTYPGYSVGLESSPYNADGTKKKED